MPKKISLNMGTYLNERKDSTRFFFILDGIPLELKACNHFVNWKLEETDFHKSSAVLLDNGITSLELDSLFFFVKEE